jgi:hypothetical protein
LGRWKTSRGLRRLTPWDMKRSRVNEIMGQAEEMILEFGFRLPPFA